MISFSELSAPITITTSTPAESTIATSLSTARKATSPFPSARSLRKDSELGRTKYSTSTPYLARMPRDSATITGSGRARQSTRIFCGAACCACEEVQIANTAIAAAQQGASAATLARIVFDHGCTLMICVSPLASCVDWNFLVPGAGVELSAHTDAT